MSRNPSYGFWTGKQYNLSTPHSSAFAQNYSAYINSDAVSKELSVGTRHGVHEIREDLARYTTNLRKAQNESERESWRIAVKNMQALLERCT